MAFDVEDVPDQARLFRRIHESHLLEGGIVSSAAFKDERMSVNWERYSTAEDTAIASSAAVVAYYVEIAEHWAKPLNIAQLSPKNILAQIKRTRKCVERNIRPWRAN